MTMPEQEPAQDPTQAPIFILGSGRCGSTFFQTMLCSVDDVWIWGEHDGMLAQLLGWGVRTQKSQPLNQFSFPFVGQDPWVVMRDNATHAAWLGGFNADDVVVAQRLALEHLFCNRLPVGKRRWGFKEIRYGADSVVPGRLLGLYPAARIIHVVRDPIRTVESSLRAWHRKLVLDFETPQSDPTQLKEVFDNLLNRWVSVTGHLLELEQARPAQVRTIRLEDGDASTPVLAEFLGISATSLSEAREKAISNPARIAKLDTTGFDQLIDGFAQATESRYLGLAQRLGYR